MQLRSVAMFALPLFVLGGCTERPARDERVAASPASIINGQASTPAQDAVVAIAMRPGGTFAGLCTGTLVAPNLVLTARHCVAQVSEGNIGCTADGQSLAGGAVEGDYDATALSIYRGVSATKDMLADRNGTKHAAARGKQLVTEGASTLCNADLAFLVLDAPVPPPYAPLRLKDTPRGEVGTAVGYGLMETGDVPQARLQRAGVSVLEVGSVVLVPEVNKGLGDSELLVGESVCSGDSGGPLLAASGAVVAVVSRGGGGDGPADNPAGHCAGAAAVNIYTHLAKKRGLVDAAFAAAGARVWEEGAPNPFEPAKDAPCTDCHPAPPRALPEPASHPTAAPAPSDPTSASDSGGCSASGAPNTSTACGAFVAIVLAALALKRRRR
jgi:MYXO-CTERM domain-containing protein